VSLIVLPAECIRLGVRHVCPPLDTDFGIICIGLTQFGHLPSPRVLSMCTAFPLLREIIVIAIMNIIATNAQIWDIRIRRDYIPLVVAPASYPAQPSEQSAADDRSAPSDARHRPASSKRWAVCSSPPHRHDPGPQLREPPPFNAMRLTGTAHLISRPPHEPTRTDHKTIHSNYVNQTEPLSLHSVGSASEIRALE